MSERTSDLRWKLTSGVSAPASVSVLEPAAADRDETERIRKAHAERRRDLGLPERLPFGFARALAEDPKAERAAEEGERRLREARDRAALRRRGG